jgi:ABC-2 type transport system permease protein
MEITIPATSTIMKSLLRADLITQWRNRRSLILILLVPVIILISWKGIVDKLGGPFALSNCITIGLVAIGLMGYSNSVARDREKAVFQRLRVAPLPSWTIMASRLIVQLAMVLLVTIAVFVGGYYFDKITISPVGYIFSFLAALIGGALYLSLGQVIVGLIRNPETVNSTSRLVYFVFIMVGMFGELGVLGKEIGKAVHWSPYGTVKTILSASMEPATWTSSATWALLLTILYTVVLAGIGIRKFQWNAR